MQGNKDRILTTHVGSLPRTVEVLDAMKAKLNDGNYDEDGYQANISHGVANIVRKQAALGIDVVTDGEMSKSGFLPTSKKEWRALNHEKMKSCDCLRQR